MDRPWRLRVSKKCFSVSFPICIWVNCLPGFSFLAIDPMSNTIDLQELLDIAIISASLVVVHMGVISAWKISYY